MPPRSVLHHQDGGREGWQAGSQADSPTLVSCSCLACSYMCFHTCAVLTWTRPLLRWFCCLFSEKTESASGARRVVSNQARCLAFTCHVSALPSHASWLSWSLAACCVALLRLTFTREPQKAGAWRFCTHLGFCLHIWHSVSDSFSPETRLSTIFFLAFFLCPTKPWNTFLVVCLAPYFCSLPALGFQPLLLLRHDCSASFRAPSAIHSAYLSLSPAHRGLTMSDPVLKEQRKKCP